MFIFLYLHIITIWIYSIILLKLTDQFLEYLLPYLRQCSHPSLTRTAPLHGSVSSATSAPCPESCTPSARAWAGCASPWGTCPPARAWGGRCGGCSPRSPGQGHTPLHSTGSVGGLMVNIPITHLAPRDCRSWNQVSSFPCRGNLWWLFCLACNTWEIIVEGEWNTTCV